MATSIQWSFKKADKKEEPRLKPLIPIPEKFWGSGERKEADNEEIVPFKIDVPQNVLDDLKNRLDNTRLPQTLPEDCEPWWYGFDQEYMKELIEYWRTSYNWREHEKELNSFSHFKTEIDGINLHFIHQKSPRQDAKPLILSHGWPGSVWEFENLIPNLTNPDDPSKQAFHVVAPSIPGYGWSSTPKKLGYNAVQTALTFSKLMHRLGYNKYIAQGGDWGSLITTAMPLVDPSACEGIHLQLLIVGNQDQELLSEEEKTIVKERSFGHEHTGYSHEHSTKPQTLSFGLSDSPIGVAAWVMEKFHGWSDLRGDSVSGLDKTYTKDELLTNVMIYWITNTISSSVRYYKENNLWNPENLAQELGAVMVSPIMVPTGHSDFPAEIIYTPRIWAEQKFKNIVFWREHLEGGHFAAREVPHLLAEDIREFVRHIRK